MSHVVEVRHIGLDHDAALAELRCWLDRQGVQPMRFEHSTGGPGITFRVHFTVESEAAAFAKTFHGWLSDGREPKNGVRWDLGNIAVTCAGTSAISPSDRAPFRKREDHAAQGQPAERRGSSA